ncbi:MAG: hypothetical protein EA378_00260 [Phycisphaerales bacterium]|nr:MAG: hypothetical protein EA378_00260 [Phycisphaerales bacterium]
MIRSAPDPEADPVRAHRRDPVPRHAPSAWPTLFVLLLTVAATAGAGAAASAEAFRPTRAIVDAWQARSVFGVASMPPAHARLDRVRAFRPEHADTPSTGSVRIDGRRPAPRLTSLPPPSRTA